MFRGCKASKLGHYEGNQYKLRPCSKRLLGKLCRMPALQYPGTARPSKSCSSLQRRRYCRNRLNSFPILKRGLCLRSTCLACRGWLRSGLWMDRSCLRGTALLLALQWRGRSCLWDRRCRKLRHERSRSRQSSCLLKRRGLWLSSSCLPDTLRRWAALSEAAFGLQSTMCRMRRTRLQRNLLDTCRQGRRGQWLSSSCLPDTLRR